MKREGRAGRRAALLAGVCLVLTLLASFPYRSELLAGFHVVRLRLRPGYLGEIILEPSDSPRGRAVRSHLATRPGQEAFLAYLARILPEALKEIMLFSDSNQGYSVTLVTLRADGFRYRFEESSSRGGTNLSFLQKKLGAGVNRLLAVRELLPVLDRREFTLPERPGLTFSFIIGESAFAVSGLDPPPGTPTPEEECFLLIRRSLPGEAGPDQEAAIQPPPRSTPSR